jgi:hypothetical protein
MTFRGTVKNGVVVLESDAKIPEGTAVRVETETIPPKERQPLPEETPSEDDPLLRMLKYAAPTGIPDLSINADHYLYGHPKKDDAK